MDVFGLTCVIVSVSMWDQVGSVLSDRQVSDVVKVFVTEWDDVILPCAPIPKVNIEEMLFDWKKDDKEVFLFNNGRYYGNGLSGQDEDFKGRVSHFVEELKHGNASILIKNITTTDSGNYSCIFTYLQPRQTFRIELVVDTQGTLPVAAGVPIWAVVVGGLVGAVFLALLVGGVVHFVHKRKKSTAPESSSGDEETGAREETIELNVLRDEAAGARAEETIELNGTVEQV